MYGLRKFVGNRGGFGGYGVYGGDVVWGTSGSGVFFIYRWSNHSRCACFNFASPLQYADTTIYSR